MQGNAILPTDLSAFFLNCKSKHAPVQVAVLKSVSIHEMVSCLSFRPQSVISLQLSFLSLLGNTSGDTLITRR